jgi:hypothetical protein
MYKSQLSFHQRIRLTLLAGCIATCPLASAYDPIDCVRDISKVDPEIIVGLAVKLCAGAYSPEPVKCYARIGEIDKGMIRGIAIDLCAGSIDSDQTIGCYVKAGNEKLNRGLSTTLCGVRKSDK